MHFCTSESSSYDILIFYISGYLIFYTTDDSYDIKDWIIEPVVGDKLSTKIDRLTEDTQYYFKALARNKQGVGPYSDVVSYRTGNSGQPSQCEFSFYCKRILDAINICFKWFNIVCVHLHKLILNSWTRCADVFFMFEKSFVDLLVTHRTQSDKLCLKWSWTANLLFKLWYFNRFSFRNIVRDPH